VVEHDEDTIRRAQNDSDAWALGLAARLTAAGSAEDLMRNPRP
jgi:hypothetical protein